MTVTIRPVAPLRAVAEVDGAVVGTSEVRFWDEADGTRLYLLTGEVDPAWRRRGIGRRLLAGQEEQAAAHWRAEPGAGPPLTGLNAGESEPGRTALARAAGYRVRFTVVSLARETEGAQDPPAAGFVVRGAVSDDLEPLRRLLRTCFAGSGLGQEQRDWDRLDLDPGMTLVAVVDGGIAGAVVNEPADGGAMDTPWVAVAPPHRRRGIARVLLQRNLRMLAGRGVRQVTLRTVLENPNHTVQLYERAGYRVTARYPRWAKPLTPRG